MDLPQKVKENEEMPSQFLLTFIDWVLIIMLIFGILKFLFGPP